MMFKRKEFWLGAVISAVCLYFFIRGVEWGQVPAAMAGASWGWIVPAVVFNLLSFVIRSYRWRWLLIHVKPIPVYPLFKANMIGFMALNLLPARVGEIARAYAIGRMEQIPAPAAFATIIVERLFDAFAIVVLLVSIMAGNAIVGGAGLVPLPPEAMWGGVTIVVMAAVLIGGLLALQLFPAWFDRALVWLLRPFPEGLATRVRGLQQSFISGISLFLNPWNTLAVALSSVVMWLAFCGTGYTMLLAFRVEEPSLFKVMFIVVFLAMGVSVPASPGAVGPYHAMGRFAMGVVYPLVAKEIVVSYVLVCHLASFVPVTLIGLWYAWMEGIRLTEFSKRAEESPAGA